MEQPNCLSSTPFFHCIFVVLSRLASAFSTLAFGLSANHPSAYNYPWCKKLSVARMGAPGLPIVDAFGSNQ